MAIKESAQRPNNRYILYIIILVLTNLTSATFLVKAYSDLNKPKNIAQKNIATNISHKVKKWSYKNNYQWYVDQSYFKVYSPKQVNVVMLGDSITNHINWNELLSRDDIINRGIGSDVTEGFIHRLDDVIKLKPKLCFIMGGINDLGRHVSIEQIADNFDAIITRLKNHNITPIIESTLFFSTQRPDFSVRNPKVTKLNKLLKQLAAKYHIQYLNVNEVLSNKNILLNKYSYDGVHLLGPAYALWGSLIKKTLPAYGL